jgi:hypothetical protein
MLKLQLSYILVNTRWALTRIQQPDLHQLSVRPLSLETAEDGVSVKSHAMMCEVFNVTVKYLVNEPSLERQKDYNDYSKYVNDHN